MCVSIFSYSQEKYQPFIDEIVGVYYKNLQQFQQISDKTMQNYFKSQREKKRHQQSRYSYLPIPELLLKKSKKLYRSIDSTNIVQYFDNQSLFYSHTLVFTDSIYVGEIEAWSLKIRENKFYPVPKDGNFYSNLYNKIAEIKPDVVFTVQNIPGYYFIQENQLYVLDYQKKTNSFIIYSIDEYTKIFKDKIFFLFKYEPRLKPIICY
jgi:hypothetical protein